MSTTIAPKRTTTSLTAALYSFVLVSSLVASVIMLVGIRNEAQNYEHAVQGSSLEKRTRALARGLAEALEREWSVLTGLAEDLPAAGPDELDRLLNRAAQPDGVVRWAGFAGADGRISAASDRHSKGRDVSQLPWFVRGLVEDFAAGSEPALVLATPVERANGNTMGVLAFRFDPDWPRRAIDARARDLGLDVFLLNGDGKVALRGGVAIDAPLDAEMARLTVYDATGAQLGRDATGARFLTMVTDVAVANMPALSWRIVSRVHAQPPGTARAELMRGMVVLLAALFAEVMLATYAYIRIFIRPLGGLADNAHDIAEGADVYPVETTTSREGEKLSWALARLQSQARSPSPAAAPALALAAGKRHRPTAPLRPQPHPDAMPEAAAIEGATRAGIPKRLIN
jgi:hypothetical protein